MAPIVHLTVLPTYKCKRLDCKLSMPITKTTTKIGTQGKFWRRWIAITLILVMISQVLVIKPAKLFTSNVCGSLYTSYTSIELFLKSVSIYKTKFCSFYPVA